MRNKIFFLFFLLLAAFKMNAQVTVTSSDSVSCSTLCTTLTAHVTGDNPTNAGITVDDYYPNTVNPIGFNFNFYGNTYTSCLIGPNGTICFNTADVGMYTDWTISAPLLGNSTVYNSICGPWCDIDVVYGGTITYSLTGTAPYRKYIVSFCATHMFSCTSQATTTQIILYETTNVVEVHVATKPVCSGWNGGYAIIGVQNATGTAATTAPGRDYPSVYTCTNEAWRFTPDATFSSYSVASIPYAPVPLASSAVYWYNSTTGAFLGTGATQTVCPTTTTTYKAGALSCADTSFGYYTVVPAQIVTASFSSIAPITTCGGTTSILVSGLFPDSVYSMYYTYNGVPMGPITFTASSTGTYVLSGAGAGTYTNMYVVLGTCNSAPQTLVIAPPPITIYAEAHDPTVCGYNDGYIVLSGYTPNTSYNISYVKDGTAVAGASYTSNSSGTITLSGLRAGSYTNIASTGGPCPPVTVAGPVMMIDPPPPTLAIDSAVVNTCVGISVPLHVYAAPTGITYYYSWTPSVGLSDPNISNPVVTPTSSGDVNYVVTVNPSPGVATCASTETIRVHTIGDFTIPTAPATICLLVPRVSVPVSVSGSGEMTYVWSPAAETVPSVGMNTNITPNTAGIHIYTVTGSYAHCPDYVHTYTISVDEPATGIVVRDTICLGMSDMIDMSASGGPGYHYAWTSTPAGVTFSNDTIANPVFTPGAVGAYTLAALVTSPNNAAGCGTRDSVFLLVLPNSLTVSPTDTAICLGQVVQAIGTLQYSNIFSYQWLPTAGIAVSNVLNALITPDTSALYTVVASFHKCPDISATLNLDVQPNPTVYLGGSRSVCQFDTLHLHATVAPAWYSHYNYTWTPATSLDVATGANVVFSSGVSTMVVVSVSTPAGCTGMDSAFVTVNSGNFASAPVNADFCPHESKVISLTSTEAATFRWIPSMYVSDSTSANPTLSPITTQTYTIIGTSANGCTDTVYWTATVYPDALVELGDDSVVLYPGESYTMDPSTNCVTFSWFPYAGLTSPFISNPVATPDVSTTYILTGTTEHGCVASDSINVIVNEESVLAMPNAFTPGTGSNNTFKVLLRGTANINYFRVYNRWGNLMFETKNINEGWDGTYKGEAQQMGVYVYDVQAVTSTGKVVQKRGNVTLIR